MTDESLPGSPLQSGAGLDSAPEEICACGHTKDAHVPFSAAGANGFYGCLACQPDTRCTSYRALQSGAGSVGEEPDSPPASDTERACGDVATLRGWKWCCTRAEGHLGHHAVHDADEGFEIHRWARSPLVSVEEPSVEQWIESRRSPDSPDIRGLLDAVEDRHEEDGACPACTHPSCERRRQRSAEAITARASLESAFSVLRGEVERLRRTRDDIELADENESLRSELARRLRGQTND